MEALRLVEGDATDPQTDGRKIVAHVCNDIGAWGKGFVLAVARRWPEPEEDYRQWFRDRADNDFGLGAVRLVQVQPEVWVANMVGQHGIKPSAAGPPIRYDAVAQCLASLANHAVGLKASVHMPRIGCGLAGGRWELIEPIIVTALCRRDVVVTVYDLP